MSILMSEQVGSLAAALAKAQLAMDNVPKDKQAYGYKHADLAGCIDAAKKQLGDNGLSVAQLIVYDGDKNQHNLISLLLHESGQWLKSTFQIESVIMKQCNSLQQLGAGISYARRYAFCALVGLAQEDDDAASIPKSAPKNEPIPAPNELAVKANELVSLCNKHKIDVKDFAKFHSIDSKNIESVKLAIVNFAVLRDQFINQEVDGNGS